jgi:microsomal epoxide hydrolase
LPGYGFSGAPRAGLGPHARRQRLPSTHDQRTGYPRYGTQGGDWGSIITSHRADHPEHVIGAHLNFILATPTPEARMKAAKPYLDHLAVMGRDEMAYNLLQSTKPMSAGIAQTDSPAGLAAWIVEKFRAWSDCNGDVESVFSKDTPLTNIMFYWATGACQRRKPLLRATSRRPSSGWPAMTVPVGIAHFLRNRPLPRRLDTVDDQRHPLDRHASRRPLRRPRTAPAPPRRARLLRQPDT